MFEVDPNYLVQTEPHSAFVTRSLGFTVCGEEGTRVNFPPPAAPSVLEIFLLPCRRPKRKKTKLVNFVLHYRLLIHVFIVHIVNKTVIFKKETMTKRRVRRIRKRRVKDRVRGWRDKGVRSGKEKSPLACC